VIAIVGGGITGLAAAYRIGQRLGPGRCAVFEASPEFGGMIRTRAIDGLLIEEGPDAFLAAKPAAAELCRALGLGHRLIATEPVARRAWVRHGARLSPLPAGLTGLVPSRLGPLVGHGALSLAGRLRAALEFYVPRGGAGEESVEEFVRRRFGGEVWTRIAEPLLAGISAGDGRSLSLPVMIPRLAEMERRHGGVLRAALGGRPLAAVPPVGFLTLRGGLGELVEALIARIGAGAVHAETPVGAIRPFAGRWRLETPHGSFDAADVLLAVPAWAAAPLVAPLDAGLAEHLDAIPFSSSALVTLAWPAARMSAPLAGSGWLVPAAEGGPAIAVSVASNKFAGRAPPDTVLLRVFLGRGGDALLGRGDASLIADAIAEAAPRLGLSGDPTFRRVTRWPRALPLYLLGHAARVAAISERAARIPGLALAGASYRGVGIPDCVAEGFAAADRLAVATGAAA
jgi:protoporphyrinogen/coproporphyrinogen III oxidase